MGKARSFRAEGVGVSEKIADAVRKVLADPRNAEWMPRLTERESLYVSGNRKRRSAYYAK